MLKIVQQVQSYALHANRHHYDLIGKLGQNVLCEASGLYAFCFPPLIDKGLGKIDCLAMLQNAGIELPEMYKLGYLNNNCIGCVKGGMGYWNKIKVDFPEQFDRMAKLERLKKQTIFKDRYLDELKPVDGNYPQEPNIECSIFCHIAEQDIVAK